MTQARLTPCFKGERDYVQGGDLLDGLVGLIAGAFGLAEPRDLRFSVHEIVRTNLDVRLRALADAPTAGAEAATLAFRASDARWQLGAAPDGSAIEARKPFDEARIIAACEFAAPAQSALLRDALPFTPMEAWVAMNKALLQRLFPQQGGKWLFVKAELERYAPQGAYRELGVALTHNFNFRLTKSAVSLDGARQGFIYFSLK